MPTATVTVRVADGDGGPDREVVFRTDRALTGADLARAWGATALWIDGRPVGADRPLLSSGLADGATVTRTVPDDRPRLLLTGGPLPPAAWPLSGPALIGRGRRADVRLDHASVRPAHALVEPAGARWTVADLGAESATSVDGTPVHGPAPLAPAAVLAVGDLTLQLAVPAPLRQVAPPRQPWHRPPRAADRPLVPPPDPPEVGPPPTPPGLLGLLLPVAVGLVLAVTIHPTAGLFAIGAPAIGIGAHLDGRRRHRRSVASAAAEHRVALAEHRRAAAARDRARRVTPADTLGRAAGNGLWDERAPGDLAVAWSATEPDRPLTISGDGLLGVAGPRAWAEGVAAAVTLELAVRHGPADRALSADAPWARWLPHPGGLPAVVTAERVDLLPEAATAVLRHDDQGACLDRTPVRPMLLDFASAERAARALARWTDPDGSRGGVPDEVALSDLVAPAAEDGRTALVAPIGADGQGPVLVDLVKDGPHALVAGTTGAGKSELLRSWVVGLARRHPPRAVAFVLVDYKGGSAFAACRGLPHVAGVITDLDAGLGDRLLRGLAAEIRDREARLLRAGVADLRDWGTGPGAPPGPPPRLVLVVDEFATLAAELPDLLSALVDVARRGRSLGLHLVLATQRPAGVVSDDIRANAALRICLRTVDPADSGDVLGDPRAAALPADRPGRAWLRPADGELRLVQVATTSGTRPPDPPDLTVRVVGEPGPEPDGPTDLERLVAEIAAAGGVRPSSPWLPPLPERLAVDPPTLGLVDRPDRRRQDPLLWDPGRGHLVVVGRAGSGRSTAVRTALGGLARTRSPEALHLYVVDGGRALVDLARLPHCGAVVAGHDGAGVGRVLGRLRSELELRRVSGTTVPLIVLALDGADLGLDAADDLDPLARDGPAHGLALVVAAARATALPRSIVGTADPLVVLALDDPAEQAVLGLRPVPAGPPGRGRLLDGDEVQLGVLDGPLPEGERVAPAVTPLPDRLALDELEPVPGAVVVGRRDRDLRTAALTIEGGRPVVVAGPPRSGRTTALELLAARADGWPVTRDPTEAAALLAHPERRLLVIDDGERVADPDGALAELVRRRHPEVALVVAVRADAWRTAYGTWLAELRPADVGLALHPDPVRDADSWTVPLRSAGPGPLPPGRGLVVSDARAEVVQVARGGP